MAAAKVHLLNDDVPACRVGKRPGASSLRVTADSRLVTCLACTALVVERRRERTRQERRAQGGLLDITAGRPNVVSLESHGGPQMRTALQQHAGPHAGDPEGPTERSALSLRRYRTKQVVVQAVRVDATDHDGMSDLVRWCGGRAVGVDEDNGGHVVAIDTVDGTGRLRDLPVQARHL